MTQMTSFCAWFRFCNSTSCNSNLKFGLYGIVATNGIGMVLRELRNQFSRSHEMCCLVEFVHCLGTDYSTTESAALCAAGWDLTMFCLQLLAPSPQLGRESQMVEFHEQHGLISSADDTIEPHANRPVEDLAMQTFSVQGFGAPSRPFFVQLFLESRLSPSTHLRSRA